jgi:hypothetical protein
MFCPPEDRKNTLLLRFSVAKPDCPSQEITQDAKLNSLLARPRPQIFLAVIGRQWREIGEALRVIIV